MSIKQTLSDLGVRPSKGRGQNFLLNLSIADQIVDSFHVARDEPVLEIGPGLGVLTQRLIRKTSLLRAVEVEESFCDHLRRTFPELSGDSVVNADIREVALSEVVPENWCRVKIVSNVPYSISSSVVLWVLAQGERVSSAHLLLQEEFAHRVCSDPGTKSYGSLSVYCRLLADTQLGISIDGNSFYPKANVSSSLLTIRPLAKPRLDVDLEIFERTTRAAFSTRRKTLLNSLANGLGLERSDIQSIIQDAGIDPLRRAETLSLEEFAELSRCVGARS